MKIGIFAKTFTAEGALPVLQAVRAAGYEVAQFNMACVGLPALPDKVRPEVTSSIAGASRSTGVGIAAISATYNMIHPDTEQRKTGLERLETIIASARAMGTRLVTLCTGTRDAQDQWRHHPDNTSKEAWRDLIKEMEKAIALADHHDIDLGIEPELANVVSSARAARLLLDTLNSPRLKIVLDPANLFERADEPERRSLICAAVDLVGGSIAMAHAKDRDAEGKFVAAGKGVIDFRHFVACLRSSGFDGPLVTHGLTEAEAPGVAGFLRGICA